MSEFFQMGGYGGFVWPAYGVSAVILGGLIFHTLSRHYKLLQKARNADAQKKTAAPSTNGSTNK